MRIIATGRRSGKTTELVRVSSKENKYIICLTRQQADHIARVAMELGLKIPYPITAAELPLRRGLKNNVLVDDADKILQYFIQQNIDMATIAAEEVVVKKEINKVEVDLWETTVKVEDLE